MIRNGPVRMPNESPGRVAGASGDYWVPLGSLGAPQEGLWPPVWGAFSGDVAFSLGHMLFHENTGIVLEGCWCLFSLPPFGRVWVPKHLQRRGTETRK